MPVQPTRDLTDQAHGGNPRYVILNHLDDLPELGDSTLIRGNASASTKRSVKNIFDAYGVGKEGCFANSVGESVRLVEVNAKGYRQGLEPVVPLAKERLEASTVAEVTISPGTPRWIVELHFAYTCGNRRDAQRSRDPTWRMHCLPDRHVRPPTNRSCMETVMSIYVSIAVAALPSSYLVTFRERMGLG